MAPSARVTPTDENESWTSREPPSLTRAPQLLISSLAGAKRWAPSMWSMSIGPSTSPRASWLNLRRYVTRSRTPARSRLARNTLLSTSASSAKPSISCGPRSLPAWGSMATISVPSGAERAMATMERPRKLPISTIRPPAGTCDARSTTRATCSGLNHPSTPSSASSRLVGWASSVLATGCSVGSGAPPPSVGAQARKSVAYGGSGTRASTDRGYCRAPGYLALGRTTTSEQCRA